MRAEIDLSLHISAGYKLGSFPEFRAEIRRGAEVGWYVVICTPGQHHIALAHLVGRGFLMYYPEMEVMEKGKYFKEGMFGNYAFVFAWDIAHHWDRIRKCPGVTGIFAKRVPDRIIWDVQVIENGRQPVHDLNTKKRYRRWRNRKITEDPIAYDEIVSVRMWSALRDRTLGLDKEERSSLLRKALGLA